MVAYNEQLKKFKQLLKDCLNRWDLNNLKRALVGGLDFIDATTSVSY
jgi:hypothetical protein